MLIRCAGISIHGIARGDLTVNLANQDRDLPFDILLACLGKCQGSQGTKRNFSYHLKIWQHFLN